MRILPSDFSTRIDPKDTIAYLDCLTSLPKKLAILSVFLVQTIQFIS
jgi:hypothetical protein